MARPAGKVAGVRGAACGRQVAERVLFPASDESSNCSGEEFVADSAMFA